MNLLNCACVIYGDAYDWGYVEKLYRMLSRNLSVQFVLHVYTETDRSVPAPFIKHCLPDLGISDPKRFWWYKMNLFDSTHYSGPLLYFDLDTVIVNNIDWIWKKPADFFWSVHDFKRIWRPSHNGCNTSIMWWDTLKFHYVWNAFQNRPIKEIMRSCHGDQDFVSKIIADNMRRFLDTNRVKSWRWQCLDGGYDFSHKNYKHPGQGTTILPSDSVLIFHGKPKPAEITDPVVVQHWG